MAVQHFTTAEFDQQVLASDKPVLVDFWATWCGPCRMLTPVIEQVSQENGDKLAVGKVNVDQQRELAKQHKVFSIPTLVVYHNGQLTARSSGVRPKDEILNLI